VSDDGLEPITPHCTADGPGEFWCPSCGRRCTSNLTAEIEYGHALDCPERPTDLDSLDEK